MEDDDSHARALAALAPYLPSGQLTRALDAAPEYTDTLLAIQARGKSLLPVDASMLIGLLRGSLKRSGRSTCRSIIAGTASSLNRLGGTHAMSECTSAILDTAH
jgi:hypothetical protein